ncbi:MAG: zf-HC2 domain-containing protein [Endomicrobia bacterium]|nr:zf-HC2 domain-containing protein [Endomicrobiia bacterium]
MNTCEKLPFYLYNEMNETETKEFENHAASCKECGDSIKAFTAVKSSAKLTSAPLQTINAIFEKTTRKKSSSFALFAKKWKITAALAASLLIGICAFSLKDFNKSSSYAYYYADAAFDEIESINYELDELENYFYFMV